METVIFGIWVFVYLASCVVALFKAILEFKSDWLFSGTTSLKRADFELNKAKSFTDNGYRALGKLIEKQTIRRLSEAFVKKEASSALPPSAVVLFEMLIIFSGFCALAIMAKITQNQVFIWALAVASLFFPIVLIVFLTFLKNDVSGFSNLRKSLKERKERKQSERNGSFLYFSNLASKAERHQSYVLIDARPSESQKRNPIHNALPLPKNLSAFTKKIEPETGIFVCSDFGKESYEAVNQLRSLGFEESYDLGGIKERSYQIDRIMVELECRNVLPLLDEKNF